MNDAPLKVVNGATVYMRDVAHVRDGYAVQQNVVRADGKPSVLLTIMKTGSVSTLDIVDEIKNHILPLSRAAAPKGMRDHGAVRSVGFRARLDQWRSARSGYRGLPDRAHDPAVPGILALHIDHRHLDPAVDFEFTVRALSALGHTMNVMTLGGLALAIGILVDDATVTIENIHRHMGRKPLREAVLDGAAQIAAPTFVSTSDDLHRVCVGGVSHRTR